jgi:hypothetical protein
MSAAERSCTGCAATRPADYRSPMSDTAAMSQSISQFWTWFRTNEAKLWAMPDGGDPFWDTALTQLQRVNKGLRFEVSDPQDGRRDFVITAWGDARLFPLVEAMVAAAPGIRRWTFTALKPAMGFDFTHHYEDVLYDPRTMWFLPLERPERPQELGLRIGVPSLRELDQDAAEFAVTVILETGLGERERAEAVHHVEVVRKPNDPAKDGYIELPDLPAYIAWRKRKLDGE